VYGIEEGARTSLTCVDADANIPNISAVHNILDAAFPPNYFSLLYQLCAVSSSKESTRPIKQRVVIDIYGFWNNLRYNGCA
jgi:hypothetical protein